MNRTISEEVTKVFIAISYVGESEEHPEALECWSGVYAHGKLEEDFHYDIILSDKEMPKSAGYYLAEAENGKTVVIHLIATDFIHRLEGRACYINDVEALAHINSPKDWS